MLSMLPRDHLRRWHSALSNGDCCGVRRVAQEPWRTHRLRVMMGDAAVELAESRIVANGSWVATSEDAMPSSKLRKCR